MKQATVSAVIPVYNNEPFIAAAVDSVLSQTRPPTDIIVVDDGSTDGTAAVLRSYGNRIKYVRQKNRGEPAARNRGIRESASEYIAFLDGDDIWMPNKLEVQMEYLRQNPQFALVYADMTTFDARGITAVSVKEQFGESLPTGRVFAELFMRSLFCPGTTIVRKECLEQVGFFDEQFLIGCDYDMWLRVARKFDFGAVDQPLLMYRLHDGMATRGLALKTYKGVPWEVAVLQKALTLFPEAIEELGKATVNRRLARPYARLAFTRFRANDFVEARIFFRKAIQYWPANSRYWGMYLATFLPPKQVAAAKKVYRAVSGNMQQNTETRANAA